jgi:hypothetical protein
VGVWCVCGCSVVLGLGRIWTEFPPPTKMTYVTWTLTWRHDAKEESRLLARRCCDLAREAEVLGPTYMVMGVGWCDVVCYSVYVCVCKESV